MALEKSRCSNESGFTLIEVMTAVALLVVALVALAQLFALSTRTNQGARYSTSTAILAEQKMEQLRALNWGFDMLGLPLSDVSTNVAAFEATGQCPAAGGGAAVGLSPSPGGTLAGNTDGYVDYVDINGCGLGGGATAPAGTVYIRRWSIEPLPTNPNNTLVLQVLVTRRADRGPEASAEPVKRLPEEARLISVKTRKTS
jgi:prepilin-type N-terminal cleavage/methylation domain-containing protein